MTFQSYINGSEDMHLLLEYEKRDFRVGCTIVNNRRVSSIETTLLVEPKVYTMRTKIFFARGRDLNISEKILRKIIPGTVDISKDDDTSLEIRGEKGVYDVFKARYNRDINWTVKFQRPKGSHERFREEIMEYSNVLDAVVESLLAEEERAHTHMLRVESEDNMRINAKLILKRMETALALPPNKN